MKFNRRLMPNIAVFHEMLWGRECLECLAVKNFIEFVWNIKPDGSAVYRRICKDCWPNHSNSLARDRYAQTGGASRIRAVNIVNSDPIKLAHKRKYHREYQRKRAMEPGVKEENNNRAKEYYKRDAINISTKAAVKSWHKRNNVPIELATEEMFQMVKLHSLIRKELRNG